MWLGPITKEHLQQAQMQVMPNKRHISNFEKKLVQMICTCAPYNM